MSEQYIVTYDYETKEGFLSERLDITGTIQRVSSKVLDEISLSAFDEAGRSVHIEITKSIEDHLKDVDGYLNNGWWELRDYSGQKPLERSVERDITNEIVDASPYRYPEHRSISGVIVTSYRRNGAKQSATLKLPQEFENASSQDQVNRMESILFRLEGMGVGIGSEAIDFINKAWGYEVVEALNTRHGVVIPYRIGSSNEREILELQVIPPRGESEITNGLTPAISEGWL